MDNILKIILEHREVISSIAFFLIIFFVYRVFIHEMTKNKD